eukprot:s2951_g6.t1
MDGADVAQRMVAAVEAAAAAAQAATQAVQSAQSAARSSGDDAKQWWRLLPKPPVFDHGSRETEIAGWREWSWTFEQYMASIDTKFADDIAQVRENPSRTVDPIDFSDAERQRNSFLYSMLSSLLRQRPLLVVKQVGQSNGLESYRMLVQQNEPASKNRSMGLLNVIMNWPAFNNKMSLMQQVLKLEHAYTEYERLGSKLNDDLKTAVLMRSVTGNLKTWLQLQVTETTTYNKVREMILLYDSSTTKWSEQMMLGVEPSSSTGDGPIPMEIDRIEQKGKYKGGGKGKSKDKNSQKGKGKGKTKGKDSKGKGKSYEQKGGKGGNARNDNKGKGKSDSRCYNCGKTGHFAKDCWQPPTQVRQVGLDMAPGSTTVQGSPSSSLGGLSSASHMQSGTQLSSNSAANTQTRVSRLQKIEEISDDVQSHDELIFDMRGSSPQSACSFHGSVHAVYHYIGDGCDEFDLEVGASGVVRTIDACVDDPQLGILIDSGADASIFPSSLLECGQPSAGMPGKLIDAQGAEIHVEAMKDVEVKLHDVSGRAVILREKVAISDRVAQPILSYGHLLQCGWGIDADRQALVNNSAGVEVPVILQNQSIVVHGSVRMMQHVVDEATVLSVRAIQAEVNDDVLQGPVGWELDSRGCGIGRHFSEVHMDPLLAKPDLPGTFYRTTLIEGDDRKWYVTELCEQLEALIQLDAEFHGLKGKRNVITFITDAEKDPRVMGFALTDGEPVPFPVRPDDDDDVEIPDEMLQVEGQDIPEGQIVVRPSPEDEVVVNGTTLRATSGLSALRAGCTFHGLSTSGSKQRCFQRLLDHSKKLELTMITAAAKEAQQQQQRDPLAPVSAQVPSEVEQAKHRLTHVPYASWCPSCIAHRAKPDRHENTGESHAGPVPTLSFDFFYTKSDGKPGQEGDADAITALIAVCSHTGFLTCIPLERKSQLDHANRELIKFVQMLGHSEIIVHCDNEPAILQIKNLFVRTRQAMGLKTRESSAIAYDKGNSLAENAIGRVRPLACSLMHNLHGRIGIQLQTSSAMWSWALRHSAWLISRFAVIRGATAHELAFGRVFTGELCEFGEPVYAYVVPQSKAAAKWKRMVFLGKAETQNSYVLFDGEAVVLSKSVRRISTTWRSHLAFYLHCKCFSWQYKTGFGARILPTMKKPIPRAVTFDVPLGPIEESALHDKDAEDVIKYAEQQSAREKESLAMTANDPMKLALQQKELMDKSSEVPASGVSTLPMEVQAQSGGAASSSQAIAVEDDPGLAVPTTPPREYVFIDSPRREPTTRDAETPEDPQLKRQRIEESKKQRINQMRLDYEKRLTEVKIAYKEYFTADDYGADLNLEDGYEDDEDEVWAGEDAVQLPAIPPELWSDDPIDKTPGIPEQWIEEIADAVEIQRLCKMQVLIPAKDFDGQVTGHLTTKFVRDWRLKDFEENGVVRKRWMRRSRYVAREFANTKRLDTFAPATGAHTSNILPLKYLWMKQQAAAMQSKEEYDVVLGCIDVKDAFLQVEQAEPILVKLQNESYIIKRNLPGQRLGAKQWFLHLKAFLQRTMAFEFSSVQPCMACTSEAAILIHVDDILFVGRKIFWEKFLKEMDQEFSISHEQLSGVGSKIKSLRRTITEVEDGLILSPGTTVERVVKMFEQHFGTVRQQKIPCDSSIQLPDNSAKLGQQDATAYRSIVGLCLYISRERPDLMYTIKELASSMSSPTISSLGHLRKLVGFMKQLGDIGIRLRVPMPGHGRFSACEDCNLLLESYSDADWSSNRNHRRSTSCGMHFLNGQFAFGSSRSQKLVALSSCESEFHAMISCISDAVFIKFCAEFVFGEEVKHLHYTDSSSARQLASRQGTGRMRHLSGKLLWLQERTQDKAVELRQVGTSYNIADIATKVLTRQRLLLLMHETGLVYLPEFEDVGEEEFQRHQSKTGNAAHIKKIAKAVYRMSLVMGLEPLGAMGQPTCPNLDNDDSEFNSFWIFAAVVFFTALVTVFSLVAWRLRKRFSILERGMQSVEESIFHIQNQLADHYGYAAELGDRIDNLGETNEGLSARMTVFEEETTDTLGSLEDLINCVRYGLMEFGGFVRNDSLTREQRGHMLVQERGNFVMWNIRTSAQTTDDVPEQDDGENAEEENETSDEEISAHGSPRGPSALLDHMRADQNIALAAERWAEAQQIQQAIITLLDATSGPEPEGMSMRVVQSIRNVFQRLYRQHRNRGLDDRAERFQRYVEDMNALMEG